MGNPITPGGYLEYVSALPAGEVALRVGEAPISGLSVSRVGSGPAGPEGPAGPGLGLVGVAPATLYRAVGQKVEWGAIRVGLDTALNDPGGHFSAANHCYTAPVEGYYQVTGQVRIVDAEAASTVLGCQIAVNGSTVLYGERFESGALAPIGSFLSAVASGLVLLKAGDKVELFVEQNSAGKAERWLEISSAANRLSVHRVA